jgi:aminoglycoside 6'-N-acetyltransferase I
MQIIDLEAGDQHMIEAAAELLVEGFREHWPAAWPDLAAARKEVYEALAPEHLCCAAMDDDGTLLGWIAGNSQYAGYVWEIHPLVVHPDRRRVGVGRALVVALEERVREQGGVTLLVGTDDEHNQTSLGGVDLYPDVLEHLATIRNLHGHPYAFYQKVGFTIVGVIPDANGFGKPDILMAKRVLPPEQAQLRRNAPSAQHLLGGAD